jgi:hypothetical protein
MGGVRFVTIGRTNPSQALREIPVRRTVLALAVTAVVGGLTIPSLAAPKLPVGVEYSVKDGVSVGTTINDQPGAGASVHGTQVCVGISYQLPACTHVDTPFVP